MATVNLPRFSLSKNITCVTCSTEVTVFDFEGSEYVTCSKCFSYLHATDKGYNFIKKLTKPLLEPVLKIGSKGLLDGDEFIVITYLEKKERDTSYSWREYLVYNFNKGYATLVEFDGHWSIVKGENFIPELKDIKNDLFNDINYNKISFSLFNKYTPVVKAMIGEADWDVINDKVNAFEFIAPPFMLVKENPGPIFYLGEYIEASTIATAFGANIDIFPTKIGIGATQPSKFFDKWNNLFTISGIAIILVLVIHLLVGFIKPEKELLNQDFSLTHVILNGTDEVKPFVSPDFIIDDVSSNIEFTMSSAVDNNWLEATIVLVNEGNNQTWEVTKGIEHYSGYEGGESWSEGSQTANIMLSNIPQGKYHLNIYPATGDVLRNNLYIKAIANSSLWRNTLLTALLLCIYPAYCWIRMKNFEKKRWDNSDHSPYTSS
ncbi:DUF4178 domain-containing protein [Pedobacter frigiditerrae]|uniref:DUF4178 domain-containing protein n=1 Tax=Pedobacter frigiditerrae TaxID=2530452 RepID=UPI002930CD97|nr:DUF4178 domain-containing protein [Pedobacter frigiditerrae]